MLESFFFYDALPPNIEKGVYQTPLVVLSYLVASFASYTALSTADQLITAQDRWEKRLFHWSGAFAMGAGIWSMHFIGMLSYKMRMLTTYDWALTFLSMLIAVAVAYEVLRLVARPSLPVRNLVAGSIALGLGICAMHYTGMAAMRMDSTLRYIPGVFLLSVLIAIAASAAALWMTFTLARHAGKLRSLYQLMAAMIMGAGICGMHYTGMAAAIFIPYADCRFAPDQSFDNMALTIALITSVILGIALFLGAYKRAQTEEKLHQYMRDLERSNKELDEFSHIVSHDLKEPLRGMGMIAGILLEDYKDKLDEQGVKHLQRLVQISTRMQQLIKDLLYFSELGRAELALQKSDPNAMIEEIKSTLEPLFKERNVSIRVPRPLPHIVCDKVRITEVFRNLITNAVKYNDKAEALVEIGFREAMETPEGLERNVFYIKDNGNGIAQDQHATIFQLFKRLRRSTDKDGTGVGLTFVKKIVERYGGRIWLESRLQEGTTFYFTLGPRA